MTSASKGRGCGSEIREIEPIHEDLEDDDDIQRTPEVINLDQIKANNDEIKEALKKDREDRQKEQIQFDKFDVSSKNGFKELLRF